MPALKLVATAAAHNCNWKNVYDAYKPGEEKEIFIITRDCCILIVAKIPDAAF